MRAPKSFEDGMARLETILSQMQSEETTLSESVKLYAEAASLMEYCHAALEKRLSKWRRSTPPAAKRQTPKQKNKSNQLAGRNHYGERRV